MTDALLVTTSSPALVPFTAAHEGFVSKAYRDAGGVLTIGYGFTMRSAIFKAFWLKNRGHALKIGDTITRAEADELLGRLLVEEYSPPVNRALPDTVLQHQFDAAGDMSFNCGGGSLGWNWAKALAAGNVSLAARLLRSTAVTAGGKRLQGLVRRRADQARLLETGDYGNGHTLPAEDQPSVSTTVEEIKVYQAQLALLGDYVGPIDGTNQPSSVTDIAVRAFQVRSGLKSDGIVGPATRAALVRAVDAKRAAGAAKSAPPATGVVAGVAHASIDWHSVLVAAGAAAAVLAAVAVVFLIWRNRGRILGRRTAA